MGKLEYFFCFEKGKIKNGRRNAVLSEQNFLIHTYFYVHGLIGGTKYDIFSFFK